jgi:hypothetical protein
VTSKSQTAQAVGKSGFIMTPKEGQILGINAMYSNCLKIFIKV